MTRCSLWCRRCETVVEPSHAAEVPHAADVVAVPDVWALSLWEPWLHAILDPTADKAKAIENRPWAPYRWIRWRKWIALHSAQQFDDEEARIVIGQRLGTMPPSYQTQEMRDRRGHIHGLVRIDSMIEPGDPVPRDGGRWWVPDQYGWVIGARVKLDRPVLAPGRQKVWRVPVPAALKIAEQVPAVVLEQLAQPST